MKTIPLGTTSLKSSRLAYGCWRLAGTWNPAEVKPENELNGIKAVLAAFEAGYTLFDHADIYCHGLAEQIFGAALKQAPGMRENILIATKCGIRSPGEPRPESPHRYDFSEEHIIQSCEDSLRRMRVETIDLYQLHRPDYLADPAEVAAAFTKLKASGKVRFFGVSNFRPTLVTTLKAACPMPLIVHQVEISLAKIDCFTDGTLDQCLRDKITPLAWSPLARGALLDPGKAATARQEEQRLSRIAAAVGTVAKARGSNRAVVALAWLLKHPSGIVPIIGSTNPANIREAVNAAEMELTREEWYTLLNASRDERLP
jgi:predicted oxidoreductase